jgi:hypothetical protein
MPGSPIVHRAVSKSAFVPRNLSLRPAKPLTKDKEERERWDRRFLRHPAIMHSQRVQPLGTAIRQNPRVPRGFCRPQSGRHDLGPHQSRPNPDCRKKAQKFRGRTEISRGAIAPRPSGSPRKNFVLLYRKVVASREEFQVEATWHGRVWVAAVSTGSSRSMVLKWHGSPDPWVRSVTDSTGRETRATLVAAPPR